MVPKPDRWVHVGKLFLKKLNILGPNLKKERKKTKNKKKTLNIGDTGDLLFFKLSFLRLATSGIYFFTL